MTSIDRPSFAKYISEPRGSAFDVIQWRDTTQIPDYILKRPSEAGDLFFEALGPRNKGYIFRLRKCSRATEWGLEKDYDWHFSDEELLRLECFVKGTFPFINSWSEKLENRWGCICYNDSEPLGVIEISALKSRGGLEKWLFETIGPNREVSFQATGKWMWAQSFSAPLFEKEEIQNQTEPWTAMFEQQFASFFSKIVSQRASISARLILHEHMVGYREWIHIRTPLSTPMTIAYGVPGDWDDVQFWARWRDLGWLGEVVFDFWARDLDTWWFDTLRKSGLTIALVPNDRKIVWSPESEIGKVRSAVPKRGVDVVEIPLLTKSQDIKRALTKHFEDGAEPIASLESAREVLYQKWSLPIDYRRYPDILSYYLDILDFWSNAENVLVENKLSLALVPISGRAVFT